MKRVYLDRETTPLYQNRLIATGNEPKDESRWEILRAVANERFPASVSYAPMLGAAHNQVYDGVPLGTCYAESATAWIEYWVWRKCGRLIRFSRDEIFDVALDARGVYGYESRKNNSPTKLFATGGMPAGVFSSAYKFNEKLSQHYFTGKRESENFGLFRELADKSLKDGKYKVRYFSECDLGKDAETAYTNAVRTLVRNGPFVYVSYTNSAKTASHAWLACGADEEGLLLRNSYGKPEPVTDKWESVVKYFYGTSVNCAPDLKR